MSYATTVSRVACGRRLIISLLCLVWLQIACTSGDQLENAIVPSASTPMKFSAPGGAEFLRVVNINTINAQIEWRLSDAGDNNDDDVDDNGTRQMTRSIGSEAWESPPITFNLGSTYSVTVTWSATGVDGTNVDYAQQDFLFTASNESVQVDLSGESYNYDRFDGDGDGVNNYEELLAETSPTNADSCRQGGSDPGSTNDLWNDNCTILYTPATDVEAEQRSPYYYSTYAQGIQRILFCQGYAPTGNSISVFADGYYGPNTYEAVRAFQEANGLLVDGHVGPNTWGALQMQVENNETEVSVHSDDKYKAYGISPSDESVTQMIDDCSQVTHFFRRLSDSSVIDGWEMARTPGQNDKGPFSIAEP